MDIFIFIYKAFTLHFVQSIIVVSQNPPKFTLQNKIKPIHKKFNIQTESFLISLYSSFSVLCHEVCTCNNIIFGKIVETFYCLRTNFNTLVKQTKNSFITSQLHLSFFVRLRRFPVVQSETVHCKQMIRRNSSFLFYNSLHVDIKSNSSQLLGWNFILL